MRQRTISVAVALTASILGVVSGTAFGQASRAGACARGAAAPLGPDTVAARGADLAAAVGGRTIVVVGPDGARRSFDPMVGGADVVRHVASRAGSGTAFVLDRPGRDTVVIQTSHGVRRLNQAGEATHPAWSTDGKLVWSLGSDLRMWSPVDDRISRIDGPAGALSVFSPVFTSADALAAVVGETEQGSDRIEDEGLDNLWRYDLRDRRWSRITSFHARGDRMLAIRTPLVRADGSIEFVVVRGVSSAPRSPTFQLWSVAATGEVGPIRALPREMYLAGVLDGHRVWNIADRRSGEWRLFIQPSSDRLVDIGCGAVMVDPRSIADPDRGATGDRDGPSPAPTQTPEPTPTPVPGPTATATALPTASPTVGPDPVDGHIAGILVGDFGSVDAADRAMAAIQHAFGDAAVLEIVNSLTSPNIVRPGVWAVVMLLPNGADVLGALGDFRSRLPEYQDWSWVVSA